MRQFNERKREQAAELRAKGHTYSQIAKKLGVSVPTVGVWTRNKAQRPIKVTAKRSAAAVKSNYSLQALADSLRTLADILAKG